MIRYVISAILTVMIVGLTVYGVSEFTVANSKRIADSELSKIDAAATSLMNEEPPPPNSDAPGAKRVVTLSLPQESFSTAGVDAIVVEPISPNATDSVTNESGYNASYLRYSIGGEVTKGRLIDSPIRRSPSIQTGDSDTPSTDKINIPAESEIKLVLWLSRTDDGTVVVYLEPITSFEGSYENI